jgi:hypothetical protein
MKGSFTEIISASAEWTKTVLFKPFSVKKWLFLYIIALLAFQMQGGCGANLDFKSQKTGVPPQVKLKAQYQTIKAAFGQTVAQKGRSLTILILSLIAALVTIFFLLIQWLYSVFSFVFIDSVVNNDVSIRASFERNRPLGNSYYAWNIMYIVVIFGTLAILAKTGFDSLSRLGAFPFYTNMSIGIMASTALPYIAVGVSFFVAGSILALFITDYVLIVMYKKKRNILKAIPQAFKLLFSDFSSFVKYFFIKILLRMATAFAGTILTFLIIIFLLLPVAMTGCTLFLLYKIMPGILRFPFIAITAIIAIPVAAVTVFFIKSIFLPFTIFHRTFNIKFISRIDERYNLFRTT